MMEGVTHDQGPMDDHTQPTGTVQLPAPTAWPMVLALGIALMLAGMVTHWAISLLGLIMVVPGIVGWFFQVLPHEHHVYVDVHADAIEITTRQPGSQDALESAAQLPARRVQPCPHRPDRDAQGRGDLGAGEALDLGHQKGDSLGLDERVQRALEVIPRVQSRARGGVRRACRGSFASRARRYKSSRAQRRAARPDRQSWDRA